jgi:hypothetical protein
MAADPADIRGNILPQPHLAPLTIPDAGNTLRSPFELTPPGNKATALPNNGADGGGDGGESATPCILTNTLSPELSKASSFKLPRSVSRADSRLAAPLELALSGLERPDGAREARILLPGVDLRQHFGLETEEEGGERGKKHGDRIHFSICIA